MLFAELYYINLHSVLFPAVCQAVMAEPQYGPWPGILRETKFFWAVFDGSAISTNSQESICFLLKYKAVMARKEFFSPKIPFCALRQPVHKASLLNCNFFADFVPLCTQDRLGS